MRHFCTLFDSNYLSRGLAMRSSLMQHCPDAYLSIFAFDQSAEKTLRSLDLERTEIISLADFEDPQLLEAKGNRDAREYCWTCTPSVIRYCLREKDIRDCTYLDADLFFFSSPDRLFQEAQDRSVLITPHNFSPAYSHYSINGKYNVQFMYFRNDEAGHRVLERWREQCLEWCYAVLDSGRFGDQKYLDTWPQQYDCVHVLQDRHATLAPWNIQQYTLKKENGKLLCRHESAEEFQEPVLYHFHNFKVYSEGYALMNGYRLSRAALDSIYAPYIKLLAQKAESAARAPEPLPDTNGLARHQTDRMALEVMERRQAKDDFNPPCIHVFDRRRFRAAKPYLSFFGLASFIWRKALSLMRWRA